MLGTDASAKMAFLLVAREELAPWRSGLPLIGNALESHRPLDVVVIELGHEDREFDEWGSHDERLKELGWPKPSQPGKETVEVAADLEAPVLLGRIHIPHDLDITRVAHTETPLVCKSDVREAKRIHAHDLGRDRINGDLIRRSQDDVFDLRAHCAGTGTIARRCAVHHREEARVDLLLDREQVHECLVDPGVGIVPMGVQQATERVFHGARGRRVQVALGGRQMDDVLALEEVGNV